MLTEGLDGLMRGQNLDMAFEQRERVTVEEYLVMAEAKTGFLIGAACALGAVLAGAPDVAVRALEEFGRRAGTAFQRVDDVLGLCVWGASMSFVKAELVMRGWFRGRVVRRRCRRGASRTAR